MLLKSAACCGVVFASSLLSPVAGNLLQGEVGFSLQVLDDAWKPLEGASVSLGGASNDSPTMMYYTDASGQTAIQHFPSNTDIFYTLGQEDLDAGVTIGTTGSLLAATVNTTEDEDEIFSQVHTLSQPVAQHITVHGSLGSPRKTYSTNPPLFKFWELIIPANSTSNGTINVGFLLGADEITGVLNYYGYSGNSLHGFERALVVYVPDSGGLSTGDAGWAFVMNDFTNMTTYNDMNFTSLHYGSEPDSSFLATFHTQDPSECDADSSTRPFISLEGRIPHGINILAWWSPEAAESEDLSPQLPAELPTSDEPNVSPSPSSVPHMTPTEGPPTATSMPAETPTIEPYPSSLPNMMPIVGLPTVTSMPGAPSTTPTTGSPTQLTTPPGGPAGTPTSVPSGSGSPVVISTNSPTRLPTKEPTDTPTPAPSIGCLNIDCNVPTPAYTPGLTCTPPDLDEDLDGGFFSDDRDCQFDGDKAPPSPNCPVQFLKRLCEHCDSKSTVFQCKISSSYSVSMKLGASFEGLSGEISSTVSFTKETTIDLTLGEGANGCGQCGTIFGKVVVCEQEYKNFRPSYEYYQGWCGNRGGVYRCTKRRMANPCGKYDPKYTSCSEGRGTTVNYCDRT